MARTSFASFIERTRRQLDSGHRQEYNALEVSIDASSTTFMLLVEPPTALRFGDVLSVDFELMRVLSYNARQVTVRRGYLDTDGAAHSANAEVIVNPRFSTFDIYEATVDEVNSWGPNLYRVDAQELAIDAAEETVQLPSAWINTLGVIEVRRKWDDPYRDIQNWPLVNVRLLRSTTAWSAATSSGLLLRLLQPVASGTLLVTVALPYSMVDVPTTADLTDDVGIPESYFDFLSMGVKLRLTQDAEWARFARDQQDDARRTAETPVGSAVQPLNFGYATYTRRKQEEINKLNSLWPFRIG